MEVMAIEEWTSDEELALAGYDSLVTIEPVLCVVVPHQPGFPGDLRGDQS